MAKQTKARVEEIKEQLSKLNDEKRRIEAEDFKRRVIPLVAGAIGKTFVYRDNSYGGSDKGKWDVFRIVRDVAFDEYSAKIIYEQCQIDCNGGVTIETSWDYVTDGQPPERLFGFGVGYSPCKRAEYDAARAEALEQLASPKRLAAYLAKD